MERLIKRLRSSLLHKHYEIDDFWLQICNYNDKQIFNARTKRELDPYPLPLIYYLNEYLWAEEGEKADWDMAFYAWKAGNRLTAEGNTHLQWRVVMLHGCEYESIREAIVNGHNLLEEVNKLYVKQRRNLSNSEEAFQQRNLKGITSRFNCYSHGRRT